jgi:hypothetical protein
MARMGMRPPQPVDTRSMFRPVSTGLVALLRSLPPDGWGRPTVAGTWAVRDVVAHLLDTALRRLSVHRDGMRPPAPDAPLADSRYLAAAIDVAVGGLPHAFRDREAESGATMLLDIAGPSGGQWTLTRDADRWSLALGGPPNPTARVRCSDDAAWKLLFNALPHADAERLVQIEGRLELAAPLLQARSVIV